MQNKIMPNKTIVITGAGGVLCGAFARHLAEQGHRIALLDINFDNAKNLADEIKNDGGIAEGINADVLKKESLENAFEEVSSKFGTTADILINGAGGNHPKGTTTNEYFNIEDIEAKDIISFFDLDSEGIQFVFDLNFLGTFLPTQIFAESMAKKQGGCIINISSMNAFTPLTKIPAYSAAKAAVSNFTQWLSVYFACSGIRVNAIAPGFFVTTQNRGILFDEKGNPTPRTEKILNSTPMKRFGKPEELLGTLDWLIDDEKSGFVTGITVPVDGGFSAYSGV